MEKVHARSIFCSSLFPLHHEQVLQKRFERLAKMFSSLLDKLGVMEVLAPMAESSALAMAIQRQDMQAFMHEIQGAWCAL